MKVEKKPMSEINQLNCRNKKKIMEKADTSVYEI